VIPQGASVTNASIREVQQPSLTWQFDFDKGKIAGKIDGLDAIKQAVFKVLQTDRFWYDIYSFNYGHELTRLLGNSPEFVQSEATRMLSEALLQDDRIQAVQSVTVNISGDQMTLKFTVVTQYGSFEQEVSRNV